MIIVVIIQFQMKHLKHTCFTLYPAFALVSMNITFNSFAFLSPSSVVTCLYMYKKQTINKYRESLKLQVKLT